MEITVYQAKVNAVARCIVTSYEFYCDGCNPSYQNLDKSIEHASRMANDIDSAEFSDSVELAKKILNLK